MATVEVYYLSQKDEEYMFLGEYDGMTEAQSAMLEDMRRRLKPLGGRAGPDVRAEGEYIHLGIVVECPGMSHDDIDRMFRSYMFTSEGDILNGEGPVTDELKKMLEEVKGQAAAISVPIQSEEQSIATYVALYDDLDRRDGASVVVGMFETQEEVSSIVAEDAAHRTGVDIDVVKKLQATFDRYQTYTEEEVKALGKFDTEEELSNIVAEDAAHRTGVDIDVVKKLQATFNRYVVVEEEELKAKGVPAPP